MLGISDAEFWVLTPRELEARLTVWRDVERNRMNAGYWQAGAVAAAVLNSNPYRKNDKVWNATHFFPFLSELGASEKPQMSDEEIKRNARRVHRLIGGTWSEAPQSYE